jgi:hypothetical protein
MVAHGPQLPTCSMRFTVLAAVLTFLALAAAGSLRGAFQAICMGNLIGIPSGPWLWARLFVV